MSVTDWSLDFDKGSPADLFALLRLDLLSDQFTALTKNDSIAGMRMESSFFFSLNLEVCYSNCETKVLCQNADRERPDQKGSLSFRALSEQADRKTFTHL